MTISPNLRCKPSGSSAALLCNLAIWFVASCQPSAPPADTAPEAAGAVVVYKSPESLFSYIARELVTDSVRWDTIWKLTGGASGLDQPLPPVDFSRFSVLVAAGPALGAGDSVVIDSIRWHGDVLTARVTAYTICSSAQISQVPVEMVRIRKGPRKVRVTERKVSGPNCLP